MISLKSYIKLNDDYIDIFEFEGVIKDKNYIEGAIELTINNIELINLEMWDYIDQLWGYFSEGLECISNNNEFKTNFPDQSIQVNFKPIGKNVLFSVHCHSENKVIINKDEFIHVMSKHALYFFEKLSSLRGIDTNHYKNEIEQLKRLCS